jgi:hypothetical protein
MVQETKAFHKLAPPWTLDTLSPSRPDLMKDEKNDAARPHIGMCCGYPYSILSTYLPKMSRFRSGLALAWSTDTGTDYSCPYISRYRKSLLHRDMFPSLCNYNTSIRTTRQYERRHKIPIHVLYQPSYQYASQQCRKCDSQKFLHYKLSCLNLARTHLANKADTKSRQYSVIADSTLTIGKKRGGEGEGGIHYKIFRFLFTSGRGLSPHLVR